ncbi:UNKNOWN [Stylonychia lemnae]|uniref:YHYH domain containing protein n=1 Tax=Stylonychia lemnae TaxID=5949 RepID=A0A077ZYN9_STYLE|nr:UNKNOWN [Stylonychia lemnae]|eukprot:CDW75005.1 UNKNOWN [Stylonychia lemnae]
MKVIGFQSAQFFLFGAILLFSSRCCAEFTNSFADCEEFISNFYPTQDSDGSPTGSNNLIYENIVCQTDGICPDGIRRISCSWNRFLQVKCSTNSLKTQITVITNGMPSNCYYNRGDANYPSDSLDFQFSHKYKFTVDFNVHPEDTFIALGKPDTKDFNQTLIESQYQLDSYLCAQGVFRSIFLDSNIRYSEELYIDSQITQSSWDYNSIDFPRSNLRNSDYIVGVALNGVFLTNGISSEGFDGFYPKAYNRRTQVKYFELDICYGNSEDFNTYSYRMFSPCMYPQSPLKKYAFSCNHQNYLFCSTDPQKHIKTYTPQSVQKQTLIGIARDGRVIYGPFKSPGSFWQPCDVDVCNGRYFTGNYYGYVATMFHPYIIGCWGPGNQPEFKASCSTNPRICTGSTFLQVQLWVLAFGIFILDFAF